MKLKRLFTAILSAALTLSLCAMPAMAADGTTTTTPKTSTSTINIGQKGSITIYKRALDSGVTPGADGNGETMTAPGTALKDTGFTLYQVMNTEALLAYYNDNPTGKQVEVKDYFTNYTKDKTAAGLKEKYKTPYREQVFTNAQGVAQFTELDVGLYLVIETQAPQAVTVPAEPFLVSIPMTRIGDTAEGEASQNQKQWLYDVTVYPKNSIAKGDVKLVKQGKQGETTTPLAGVQFTLYRKSDAVGGGYTQVSTDTSMETNDSGEIALNDLTKGRYYLLETGYAANKDKGYILNTTDKFYFDIDNHGKAVMVDDDTITDKVNDESFVISNNTLTVTNYKPDIEKTVTKRNGDKAHEADYGVGDAVQYTLTIDVPENVKSLKTFKVVDTTDASQLKHNKDSVIIKGIKADENKTEVPFAETADYELTIGGNETMTVDFGKIKSENFESVAGGKIIITYTATVQSGAIVAGDGNVNTAKIVYSRKTGTDIEEGDGNQPYEITDKGVVYTFGLNIHKTGKGGAEGEKNLKGVTFDLYKKVDTEKPNRDGTYPFRDNTSCPATSGVDAKKLGLTDREDETWIKVDTLTTDENGDASAKGLPSGTYKLVETQTVEGYNLLSKPVDAKLNLTYAAGWTTTTTYDDKGNQTKSTITTPTYKIDDKPVTPGDKIEIVNRAGFTLPVTGGFGTLLFSGIGVLLVLAGVGVLFSLKKKSNRA